MLEEKEFDEQDLSKLIDKVEKDPIPTNIMTNEPDDPLVLLGKMNEIEANLKGIRNLSTDTKTIAQDAQDKATEAITIAEDSNTKAETSINTSNTALGEANNALNNSNEAKTIATGANTTASEAKTIATSANTTAGEAKTIAQNALEQVTEGLGTKVSRGTQLLNEYDIKPLEDKATANQTEIHALQDITDSLHEDIMQNTNNITSNTNRITANEADIVELTNMLSATEELATQNDAWIKARILEGNDINVDNLDYGIYFIKNAPLYIESDTNPQLFAISGGGLLIKYKTKNWITNTYVDKVMLFSSNCSHNQSGTALTRQNHPWLWSAYKEYGSNIWINEGVDLHILSDMAIYVKYTNSSNYIKFDNGLTIQWGYLSSVTNNTITLPKPFTTTNYVIVGSTRYDDDTGSRLIVCKFSHLTTTTFQITCSTQYGSDTQFRQSDAMWIAIGK